LVAAMLDLARMRAPAAEMPAGEIDLVELSRGVAADEAAAVVGRGLQTSFDATAEPVLVRGNEAALRSAVANLVANAVAHAREATALAVRVTPDRTVEVADDGPGIPPQHRQEVLEPFVRLPSGAKGTGLGLAIVREIMAAHGGSLTSTRPAAAAPP
jgi:signal transduction histidine kinase